MATTKATEIRRANEVKCVFTSVWDDGSVVTTPCTYDTSSGQVYPEVSKGPVPTGSLVREYITLDDGDELEVCHDCHEYVLKTVVGERADLSYGEYTECPNPDCPEHVLEGD
jgi:hypothetical protein